MYVDGRLTAGDFVEAEIVDSVGYDGIAKIVSEVEDAAE